MHPEKFSDHAELHNYAERHGLEYLWEGTQAFERRKRMLPPEQFEICEARTHRGMRKVLLFSKDILVAEWLRDKPRRDRLAAKRARLRAKNKAWTAQLMRTREAPSRTRRFPTLCGLIRLTSI